MKKHLLLSFCATGLFFLSASSQVLSKKDKLFGVTASLSYYSNNEIPPVHSVRRWSNIGLVPSIAWLIKDNLAIGIKAGLNYSRTVHKTDLEKFVQKGIQVGPEFFIRKYKTLAKSFGISFSHELSAFYSVQENYNGQAIFRTKSWGTGYSFIPGAFYKFSDRLLGEANFGGAGVNYYKTGNTKQWAGTIDFLTFLNIGVQFIIPAKKV